MNWPWRELGLPGPADLSEVRRAYAERLKTTHPEEDPEPARGLSAGPPPGPKGHRRAAASAAEAPGGVRLG